VRFEEIAVGERLWAMGCHQCPEVQFFGFREHENGWTQPMVGTPHPCAALMKPLQFLNIALILA
jgi:hypothetical protein